MKVEVIDPPPVQTKVILELTVEEATIIRWSLEYYATVANGDELVVAVAAQRAAEKLKQFSCAEYPYAGAFV